MLSSLNHWTLLWFFCSCLHLHNYTINSCWNSYRNLFLSSQTGQPRPNPNLSVFSDRVLTSFWGILLNIWKLLLLRVSSLDGVRIFFIPFTVNSLILVSPYTANKLSCCSLLNTITPSNSYLEYSCTFLFLLLLPSTHAVKTFPSTWMKSSIFPRHSSVKWLLHVSRSDFASVQCFLVEQFPYSVVSRASPSP